jgi:hypothetical protein
VIEEMRGLSGENDRAIAWRCSELRAAARSLCDRQRCGST